MRSPSLHSSVSKLPCSHSPGRQRRTSRLQHCAACLLPFLWAAVAPSIQHMSHSPHGPLSFSHLTVNFDGVSAFLNTFSLLLSFYFYLKTENKDFAQSSGLAETLCLDSFIFMQQTPSYMYHVISLHALCFIIYYFVRKLT